MGIDIGVIAEIILIVTVGYNMMARHLVTKK